MKSNMWKPPIPRFSGELRDLATNFMRSNLSTEEFKNRLKELVSKEKEFYFFTTYNPLGTPFCGSYDEHGFELTRNSFWKHVKVVLIKGTYRALSNGSTEVIYEVGLKRSLKFLLVMLNGLVVVGLNILIAVNRDSFDSSILSIVLTLNGFLVFANLWGLVIAWMTKRVVSQRFKYEFGIDVDG